jgi:hypothetical protein
MEPLFERPRLARVAVREPRAHGDPVRPIAPLVVLLHDLLESRVELLPVERRLSARQQDGELVAPHPCDEVRVSRALPQDAGGLDDRGVALLVAEAVVDHLQPVQVGRDHQHGLLATARDPRLLLGECEEPPPVVKPCQLVGEGDLPQPLLGPGPLPHAALSLEGADQDESQESHRHDEQGAVGAVDQAIEIRALLRDVVVELEDPEQASSLHDRDVGFDDVGGEDLVLERPGVSRDDLRALRAAFRALPEVAFPVDLADLGGVGGIEDLSRGRVDPHLDEVLVAFQGSQAVPQVRGQRRCPRLLALLDREGREVAGQPDRFLLRVLEQQLFEAGGEDADGVDGEQADRDERDADDRP